jgi:exopolysaccharide biosynthesis polyprenyl glycosylphosphotransferase
MMSADRSPWEEGNTIRRHIAALRVALMAADAMSAGALFLGVSVLRFGDGWAEVWRSIGIDPAPAICLYAAAWVIVVWLLGLYRLRTRWTARSELLDIVRAGLLIGLTTFTALFILKIPNVSRLFVLTLFASQVGVTVLSRTAIRAILRTLRDRGRLTRYMVIIGTGEAAQRFADRLAVHPELGLRVVGYVAASTTDAPHVRGPILGTIGEIERIFHARIVDEVAICLPPEDVSLVEPVTRLCEEEGKIVRVPLEEYNLTLAGGRSEEFDGIQVLSLVYGPDRAVSLAAKRLADIVLAVAALVVLAPFLAIVALAIYLMDGGPILFRQPRVGLHGRTFLVNKFRTMVPDAEARLADLEALNEISGHAFKLTHDPRLTRTGKLLRATSIDEIPQLWNVILGQMSLVGPRPPLPREVAGYDLWHRRRLSMKPGITGLWQVQARREQDFDRWVELDLAYIDRWSIWLDLKIMLRTIPAMLSGR